MNQFIKNTVEYIKRNTTSKIVRNSLIYSFLNPNNQIDICTYANEQTDVYHMSINKSVIKFETYTDSVGHKLKDTDIKGRSNANGTYFIYINICEDVNLDDLVYVIDEFKNLSKERKQFYLTYDYTNDLNNYEMNLIISQLKNVELSNKKEIQNKIETYRQEIDRYNRAIDNNYTQIHKLQLKASLNETINVQQIYRSILDKVSKHYLVDDVSLKVYNQYVYIVVKTKEIPQSFIDLTELSKIKHNLAESRRIIANKLIDYTHELILDPSIIVFNINIKSLLDDASFKIDHEFVFYNSQYNSTNHHTHYYSYNNVFGNFNYGDHVNDARRGCLGTFDTILANINRDTNVDNLEKQFIAYFNHIMQYLQTTNVLDSAGLCNLSEGKLREIK